MTVHALRNGHILCGTRKRSPRGPSLFAVETPTTGVTCKRCLQRLPGYASTDPLFRSLNAMEVKEFRQYARDNEPPPEADRVAICHPICRDEWQRLGKLPNPTDKDKGATE